MTEPTPPGAAPEEPSAPSYSPPPSAPPSAPPPSAPPSAPGYSAGPPPVSGSIAPQGYANSDDKTWALISHFGGIVVGFIAPLVAMLVKGNESPTVKAHSVEALNFQITVAIAYVISWIIAVCSFGFLFFVPFLVFVYSLIFCILAGMKANEGVLYRYPATLRLIK